MSSQKRYFDMLGAAYDVPAGTARFDAFLEAAMAFFFEGAPEGHLAEDVPRHQANDESLDVHADRITTLVEEAARREAQPAESFHAVLTISGRSGQVSGNAAARRLLSGPLPCALEDLPLDLAALKEIRAALASTAPQGQDRVILATIETDTEQACLALIQRPRDDTGNLHVSLSYIDWTEELMARLGGAFGLTSSETDVLEGYLRNLSQKDIAARRGRALETVKGQSKSILRKTGCARMADVVHLSASIAYLMRQLPEAAPTAIREPWTTPRENLSFLGRPGNRQLAWYQIGTGATPVLFVHGFIQGPFFTAAFRDALDAHGLRLIAPSRPGFGYTSPSASRRDFNQTTAEDAAALLQHLNIPRAPLFIHQGGSSHGFRLARALGDRCSGLFVLDGGVPIDERVHIPHMDRQTRYAAMASRHAPSLMKMTVSVGMPVFRARGTRAFLEAQYAQSPLDLKTLGDPELLRIQSEGLYHIIEQGAEAWVRDGAAAMADWSADLDAVTARQLWLQPRECRIIGAQDVAAVMRGRAGVTFEIVENAGSNILHTQARSIAARLAAFARDS